MSAVLELIEKVYQTGIAQGFSFSEKDSNSYISVIYKNPSPAQLKATELVESAIAEAIEHKEYLHSFAGAGDTEWNFIGCQILPKTGDLSFSWGLKKVAQKFNPLTQSVEEMRSAKASKAKAVPASSNVPF